jgi:hypothetical protein
VRAHTGTPKFPRLNVSVPGTRVARQAGGRQADRQAKAEAGRRARARVRRLRRKRERQSEAQWTTLLPRDYSPRYSFIFRLIVGDPAALADPRMPLETCARRGNWYAGRRRGSRPPRTRATTRAAPVRYLFLSLARRHFAALALRVARVRSGAREEGQAAAGHRRMPEPASERASESAAKGRWKERGVR